MVLTQILHYRTSFQDGRSAKGVAEGKTIKQKQRWKKEQKPYSPRSEKERDNGGTLYKH